MAQKKKKLFVWCAWNSRWIKYMWKYEPLKFLSYIENGKLGNLCGFWVSICLLDTEKDFCCLCIYTAILSNWYVFVGVYWVSIILVQYGCLTVTLEKECFCLYCHFTCWPWAVGVVTQCNFHFHLIGGDNVNFCNLYSKGGDAKLLILIFHKIRCHFNIIPVW